MFVVTQLHLDSRSGRSDIAVIPRTYTAPLERVPVFATGSTNIPLLWSVRNWSEQEATKSFFEFRPFIFRVFFVWVRAFRGYVFIKQTTNHTNPHEKDTKPENTHPTRSEIGTD